jgi:hypothetical protein
MLEIIILYRLCQRIGQLARAKGRSGNGYQLLLVVLWFGGEFVGAFITTGILFVLYGERAEGMLLYVYGVALLGAAVGASIVFQIVRGLPEPHPAWPGPQEG